MARTHPHHLPPRLNCACMRIVNVCCNPLQTSRHQCCLARDFLARFLGAHAQGSAGGAGMTAVAVRAADDIKRQQAALRQGKAPCPSAQAALAKARLPAPGPAPQKPQKP